MESFKSTFFILMSICAVIVTSCGSGGGGGGGGGGGNPTPPAPVTSVNLAKTGQTVSYAAGDDGDMEKGVAWPNPRFTVGIGVEAECVTDNLTGLVWVKNLNPGRRTWQQALAYVNGLSLCGHDDWRVPNRKELMSLIDRSKSNPALPSGHPFTNVQANPYFWSSTTGASNTDGAWSVGMWNGYVSNGFKTDNNYVWPVRSGQ